MNKTKLLLSNEVESYLLTVQPQSQKLKTLKITHVYPHQ